MHCDPICILTVEKKKLGSPNDLGLARKCLLWNRNLHSFLGELKFGNVKSLCSCLRTIWVRFVYNSICFGRPLFQGILDNLIWLCIWKKWRRITETETDSHKFSANSTLVALRVSAPGSAHSIWAYNLSENQAYTFWSERLLLWINQIIGSTKTLRMVKE